MQVPLERNKPELQDKHAEDVDDFCRQHDPFAVVLIAHDPSFDKVNPK